MSTDQWDPDQIVVISMRFADGTQAETRPLPRRRAEEHLASPAWLLCEKKWRGKSVVAASIKARGQA